MKYFSIFLMAIILTSLCAGCNNSDDSSASSQMTASSMVGGVSSFVESRIIDPIESGLTESSISSNMPSESFSSAAR